MDISSSLNLRLVYPTKNLQRSPKTPNHISCRATTLDTQTTSRNLYQVLSLESEKVDFEEIKKAYRSMARVYHPDVVPTKQKEESTRRFVELQQAYETLSDPILRQEYDHELLGPGYLSSGFGGVRSGISRVYSKERWEDQLHGLESRSHVRAASSRKKHG